MLTPQEALVYTMVIAAESDHEIADAEIDIIRDLVNHLPAFEGLDRATTTEMAVACSEQIAQKDGVARLFGEIRTALSAELRETAYALACDVIAVDSRLSRHELDVLEHIRDQLDVAPEMARAIEQVAKVRFLAA